LKEGIGGEGPAQAEPGSFRDRHNRVYYQGGRVLRGLSNASLADWEHLSKTDFFSRHAEAGSLVKTRLAKGRLDQWAAVLEHDRVPFVSYPYEWSFNMLKAAALLTLELLDGALDEGMTLKDSTSYNIQWVGARPLFIDIPSFVRARSGQPWAGYRQFCETFLYPLLLQAYRDVPFHPWMRGRLEGFSVEQSRGLFSLRDMFRPGVLMHVRLQAALQSRYADTRRDVRKEVREAGFHAELVRINVHKLAKLVRALRWKRTRSTWSRYAADNSYEDVDRERKHDFVRRAVIALSPELVWDLGSNTGEFARLAARDAGYVIAMDSDHLSVDRLFQRLSEEGPPNVLPLVVDLADSSPSLGWRLSERKTLLERGPPDLILALALIHHVVIGANVPLRELIAWLAGFGADLVIEFVAKSDPMVQRLLLNKEDHYADYDQGFFERCLCEHFEVGECEQLKNGGRSLYFARRRRDKDDG